MSVVSAAIIPTTLYHAAPLQYAPHILADGALYAQSVLQARAIPPRSTAKRRDKMLGLSDYVHLSLDAQTPLLADKIAKGYPHALLEFDGAALFSQTEAALLPFNAKAWRSKAAFEPVTDPAAQQRLLRRHRERAASLSLEALVKYGLDLQALRRVVFINSEEKQMVENLLQALHLRHILFAEDALLFPNAFHYRPATLDAIRAYFRECQAAEMLLPPPALPFD